MDDVDDLLFHYHATHIFVLSYLKDSMAGRGVMGRYIVLADQKDYGELFGCMPSLRLGLLG